MATVTATVNVSRNNNDYNSKVTVNSISGRILRFVADKQTIQLSDLIILNSH